jgi:HAD superfamily hydrolase (TIGR01509 family)
MASSVAQSPDLSLIIFDCDGVLVDSERISHIVLQQMLAELGVHIGFDEAVSRFMGTSMPHTLGVVQEMTGVSPADFLPLFRGRTFDAFSTQLEPVAGVVRVLDGLSTPYCVASNGPREKMELTLGRTGLLGRFLPGRLFSADDVANPKPAPDLFLHAAARLAVRPEACVVIEDTPTGVHAARAAGMRALGYCAMTPSERLRDAGAHATFDSMTLLPALLAGAGPAA